MSLIVIPTVNITPELSEVLDKYSPVRLGQQLSRNSILVERATFDDTCCKYQYAVCTDVSGCTGHYVLAVKRNGTPLDVRVIPMRVHDADHVAVVADPNLLGKKVLCVFDKARNRFVFSVGHAKPWRVDSVRVLDEENAVFEA